MNVSKVYTFQRVNRRGEIVNYDITRNYSINSPVRGRPKTKLSNDVCEEIINLYNSGYTIYSIAKILNISRYKIKSFFNENDSII